MLFKKLQLNLVLAVFGLGLLACGDDGSGSTDEPQAIAPATVEESLKVEEVPDEVTSVASDDSESTEQSQEASVAIEAKTHTVNGQATSFSPNILFINPGDTVQWANMTNHDSVSMEGLIPEGAEHWTFKISQNGAVTLTEEGVYIYKCNPHYPLGMVAAIIVGKPVNIEQVQANATGRSKGIVIKVMKALAAQ